MAHNMTFKIVALLTFLPILLVSGLAVRSGDNASAGYTVSGKMGFKGSIHGVEVELSGTVEEMYAEFTRMYPEVVANAALHANNTDKTRSLENDLQTRTPSPRGDHYCCPVGNSGWTYTRSGYIQEGMQYLYDFNGVCNTGGGPGNCVRVSCSYNAGIYLCNDNTGDLVISCKDVVWYTQELLNDCSRTIWPNPLWYTCGQVFDNANYNVIVHGDSC
ncbi:hypothetical protein BDZ45DRAFT_689391 [Acephala macrosclerotiorum]|nr:hypothetical protein BDZ45DRAFT_689391 [Acephala macrosclerotiorum]